MDREKIKISPIKHIRYWNIWRKKYSNSFVDSLTVLFGLKKSYMFIIVIIAEEQKEWSKVLDEAREAITRLTDIALAIREELKEGE